MHAVKVSFEVLKRKYKLSVERQKGLTTSQSYVHLGYFYLLADNIINDFDVVYHAKYLLTHYIYYNLESLV
jgi:hypothetical protein